MQALELLCNPLGETDKMSTEKVLPGIILNEVKNLTGKTWGFSVQTQNDRLSGHFFSTSRSPLPFNAIRVLCRKLLFLNQLLKVFFEDAVFFVSHIFSTDLTLCIDDKGRGNASDVAVIFHNLLCPQSNGIFHIIFF